ncbi:glycosyltransferase [Salinicoccus bachuensis]|uniref:Glycosyltransferase n=1 Tax=Salinicoccus bachuensis TaxID=3136731 RepID=A0ABZ3CJP0_9STAP
MQKKIIEEVTSSRSVLLVEKQVQSIENNGYKVKVVCNKEFDKIYDENSMNSPSHERRNNIFKDIRSLYNLTRYLNKEQPDIVNFCTPKVGIMGMAAGCLNHIKTRVYVQSGLHSAADRRLKKAFLYSTERLTCLLSTHVIVTSDSLEQELMQQKIVNPRKVVRISRGISNGIDLEKFNNANLDNEKQEVLKDTLGIGPSDFVIGYVGKLTKGKGVNELVEAFEKLSSEYNHLKLLLIGNFEDNDPAGKVVKERIINNSNIFHHPKITDVEYYYNMMNLFVFPCQQKELGIVSLEAQAMRVPVVTFNSPGTRDALMPNTTGLITENNTSESLGESIEYLIENPKIRKRMVQDTRPFVLENFEKKRMEEQLFEFYDAIREQDNYEIEENHQVTDT